MANSCQCVSEKDIVFFKLDMGVISGFIMKAMDEAQPQSPTSGPTAPFGGPAPTPTPSVLPQAPGSSESQSPDSPQSRNFMLLFVACAALAVFIVGIIFFLTRPSSNGQPQLQPTVIPTQPPEQPTPEATQSSVNPTTADLPPLYPGVEWEATESGEIPFRDKSNNIFKLSGYSREGKIEADRINYFINGYNSWFNNRAWDQVEYAGEPPEEIYQYEKDNKYFRFGIQKNEANNYTAFIEYN